MRVQRQRGAAIVRRRAAPARPRPRSCRRSVPTAPAVGDPLQQPLVAAVERRARVLISTFASGCFVHVRGAPRSKPVRKQTKSPGSTVDFVRLHDPHQLVIADEFAVAAEMRLEVDHHAAALDAGAPPCSRRRVAWRRLVAVGTVACRARRSPSGPTMSLAGAVAVVEDDLGLAVAVGVEQLPDMGEAVPLRRVLQRQQRPCRRRPRRSAAGRRSAADKSCWACRRASVGAAAGGMAARVDTLPPG